MAGAHGHAAQRLGLADGQVHKAQAESLRRVGQRADHFYPPSLVASQFEALQDPSSEPGVLTLAGDAPLQSLAQSAAAWLAGTRA